MKKCYIIWMIYVLSLFILSLSGTVNASVLSQLISQSWNEDDFIRAQENKIKAAELDRFARYLPNNPTIQYADSDNHSWKTYGATLVMGLPGKAFVMSGMDRAVLKAETSEISAKKNELARLIFSTYSECSSSAEIIDVLEEATQELGTLERTITARYESGQSTQSERIGIQLQLRQAMIELGDAKDKAQVACFKLRQIVKDWKNPFDVNEKDITLPDDLEDSLISSMGHRSPDVIRSENDVNLARAKMDVAVWENLPDISLSFYRNYYRQIEASPIVPIAWTSTFVVSMNIPLFYSFYNGNDIKKQRANAMIAERRAYMSKLEAEKNASKAARDFKRNRGVLERLRKHDLPMSEVMVDSTLASYKAGRLGFSELILAKRTWLDLKKEEINLKLSLLNNRLICLQDCDGETK